MKSLKLTLIAITLSFSLNNINCYASSLDNDAPFYTGILKMSVSPLMIPSIYETESGDILIPYIPDALHRYGFTIYSIRHGNIRENLTQEQLKSDLNKIPEEKLAYFGQNLYPENWPNPDRTMGASKINIDQNYQITEKAPIPYDYCKNNNKSIFNFINKYENKIYQYVFILNTGKDYYLYKHAYCSDDRSRRKYYILRPTIYIAKLGILLVDLESGAFLYIKMGSWKSINVLSHKPGIIMLRSSALESASNRDSYDNLDNIIDNLLKSRR